MRSPMICAVAALLALASPAHAQVQDNLTGVATITNTAQVPGTVSVIGTRNSNASGVLCTFNQVSEVGSPSTVITVDAEDSASGVWQALGSSSAVSVSTAASASVEIYPGAQTASLPSGMAAAGLKLPAIWRLRQVVTGGTSTTGTANCDLLR